MKTLPDYLKEGLDIVLVGLNPSQVSVERGHYFANPRNRFWRAFNQSGLVDAVVAMEEDSKLPDYGIGFTDLVKRPSRQASALRAGDYREGAPLLKEKMLKWEPEIVCFQGLMVYANYLRYAEGLKVKVELGIQPHTIGASRVFVVPNPSPANAQYSLDTLVCWFQELKKLRDCLRAR